MPTSHSLLLALVGLSSGIAQSVTAACPERFDKDNSIVLIRTEPLIRSHYVMTSSGIIEDRVMKREAGTESVTTSYSHGMVAVERRSAKGTVGFAYETPLDGLDDLANQKTWSSKIKLLIGGQQAATGSVTLTYVGDVEVELGECSYAAWVVEQDTLIEEDETVTQLTYVPSLGLVVGNVFLGPDGKPVSETRYDSIATSSD